MELLVQAVLGRIQEEMERLYWNANHKELESPFLNTGNSYKDDVFEVNAYYWGDDENIMMRPNFKYGDFECRWYKHYFRGLSWSFRGRDDVNISASFFEQMLEDCFNSMGRFYKSDEYEED